MPPSATIALAQELIRFESVTPADAGCQAMLRARLQRAGFACEPMQFANIHNLWAVHAGDNNYNGRELPKPLIVFAGHTDVVPPGPLDAWTHPPFAGKVTDGVLHGRGAADMKGGVASFITACERFIARKATYTGAIGLLITGDEEGDALHGTREVMQTLTARGVQIDMCIVGEPSSDKTLGDVIKIGRRGSVGARLLIKGVQGHIAYPIDNPIHRAGMVINALLAVNWDDGCEDFPPTCLQFSNVHAGVGAENVVPGEIQLDFNLRYSPAITETQIRRRVESILAECDCDYEIDWRGDCLPFATARGKLTAAARACVESVTGVSPALSAGGGTSDGRFIAPTGAEVVELGPSNATIHQINERVAVDELDQLSLIYEKMLEKLLL